MYIFYATVSSNYYYHFAILRPGRRKKRSFIGSALLDFLKKKNKIIIADKIKKSTFRVQNSMFSIENKKMVLLQERTITVKK